MLDLGSGPTAATSESMPDVTHDGVLRELREDDAADVLAAFSSSPDMVRQGDVTSLDDAGGYVARLAAPAGPHRAFAVVDSDRLVGLVVVTIDQDNRSGWFWYWMNVSHRGRGWTSRAAATVANWALSSGLERLELGHRVDNPASGGVAHAAGFLLEGVEREKFLVAGQRIDVRAYGRLPSDPWPDISPMPLAEEPGRARRGAT